MTHQTIAVIGAGLMGHGIALSFARGGHCVTVHDPVAASLATLHDRIAQSLSLMGAEAETTAVLARVQVASSIEAAVAGADLVTEAAPEDLPLKQAIFQELEQFASPTAILASNTSVLPITAITAAMTTGARAVGTHWWNPPHLIPLVEVIRTPLTSAETTDTTMAVLAGIGKSPVRVEKDVPGFIGNRLQHALWREAISLVERGICDAAAVDQVVKASFGRRLAVLGPLENADLVGSELTLAIHSTVLADLEASPHPSPLLGTMIEKGRLGMKSGAGFHTWTQSDADALRKRVSEHLMELNRILN
ncbi:MAG: 3-hydroxyacyl-CoA dehydrogenase family protein [Alphaproteobacteria bacterium]|nr:3-hydroxyacyl-CoA dehydrogenase family protein [Alphaproteobacteria bacterium]